MSETTNYQFPLYDSGDKPNLRDQYNGAINMIDTMFKQGNDKIDSNSSAVEQLQTAMAGKAPTMHSSAEKTYGVGTAAVFGHVKLTDSVGSSDASSGTAATQKCVAAMINQSVDTRAMNVVVIGDSYVQDPGTVFTGFQTAFPEVTWHNFGDSGSGYTLAGKNGRNFTQQVQNAYSSLGDDAPSITHVFIIGGRNDCGGQTSPNTPNSESLTTAASTCMSTADTLFPNAKICMIPCLYDWKLPNTNLIITENCIRNAALTQNVWCAYNCWSLGIGQMATMYIGGSDIHPNATGGEFMARAIMYAVTHDAPNMMRCYSATIGTSAFALLDEKGLHLTGVINANGSSNPISRDSLPSWLKPSTSDEAAVANTWYTDGSTFYNRYGINTYSVMDQNHPSDASYLFFGHEGINVLGTVDNMILRFNLLVPPNLN